MAYISRAEGIRRGIITPRGGSPAESARRRTKYSRGSSGGRSGGVPMGVKKRAGGRNLISLGLDSSGKQLWVTEDKGTYLYSYKGATGNLIVGGFDTSITAGRKAKKSYLDRFYKERKQEQRVALQKRVAAEKNFESQVKVIRKDLDLQFGLEIGKLKSRRWSPRVASRKRQVATGLTKMRRELKGLSTSSWLKEMDKLAKQKITPIKKTRRRLPIKTRTKTGRRGSGR